MKWTRGTRNDDVVDARGKRVRRDARGERAADGARLDEAITTAQAIGDDRLQKQAGMKVTPEPFTHGTSAQRVTWFRRGFDTGRLDTCDTFSVPEL